MAGYGHLEESRRNNFDAIRLVAALAVLVSHAFAIAGEPQPKVGGADLGIVGVYVFFGVSGFLIAQSWTTDPHLWRFLAKRCLRILPGLLVMLAIVTLILGPATTVLSVGDYFTDDGAWRYLLQNAVFITTHELPGVFLDNPAPREVNASIHTLRPEVWAYLAVAGVGLLGGLRSRVVVPLIAIVLLAAPRQQLVPWPVEIFMLQAFAVGASLYVLRDQVPWRWSIAIAAVGCWLVAPERLQDDLVILVLPYVTMLVAYRGPGAIRRLAWRGDYSYGIYIYAWPIAQTLAAVWGPSVTPAAVILIGGPITYAVAVVSWVAIERPALALKHRLRGATTEPRVEPESSALPSRLITVAEELPASSSSFASARRERAVPARRAS